MITQHYYYKFPLPYPCILPFLIKCTRVTATTSIITIIKIGTNTPTDTDVINMLLLLIVAEVKVVVLAPT